MAEENFSKQRISNFQGLVTLTLDQVILHTASLIDLYIHAKFHWNQRKFCGQTDERRYGRMDIWDPLY